MRKKIQGHMFEFCYVLELLISAIVGIAVVVLCGKLFLEMVNITFSSTDNNALVEILDKAMILAIGVEFIKMLCKHTPETVIEVLLFAIARQMVLVHTSSVETLLAVGAIAVLFGVRKFLLRNDDYISKTTQKLFKRSKKDDDNNIE